MHRLDAGAAVADPDAWAPRAYGVGPSWPPYTVVSYSSVTHPSDAGFTLLMYLYSVPRVAL